MPGVVFCSPTKAHPKVRKINCAAAIKIRTDISPATNLSPYVESIFQLINHISNELTRSEGLMRSTMGVIGYVTICVNLFRSKC